VILKNARIFTGGCDLTAMTNKVDLGGEAEEKDATTFASVDANGQPWKDVMAGLASAKIAVGGFWEAGDTSMVDDALWAQLGGLGAWSIGPTNGNVGSTAWLTKALQGQYKILGSPGEIAPYEAAATSSWPLARGLILHPPGTARTATGTGTAVELGAVPADRELFANVHVLSVAGTSTPTITVKIQSDDLVGFGSATDRLTFTGATARGGQSARVAGPITDTWFRAQWTITGTTPSFLFVVTVGIG
jgi:hypothetical protein